MIRFEKRKKSSKIFPSASERPTLSRMVAVPCLPACLPACPLSSLPACLPTYQPACPPACLHACLPAFHPACLPAKLWASAERDGLMFVKYVCPPPVSLPACLPACPPACLPARLPACLPAHLPACLPARLWASARFCCKFLLYGEGFVNFPPLFLNIKVVRVVCTWLMI
jgi:hypothetical protein